MNNSNHILTKVWLQFQNIKCSLLALKFFQRFSKLLKIWKSGRLDLTNVTGTSYD